MRLTPSCSSLSGSSVEVLHPTHPATADFKIKHLYWFYVTKKIKVVWVLFCLGWDMRWNQTRWNPKRTHTRTCSCRSASSLSPCCLFVFQNRSLTQDTHCSAEWASTWQQEGGHGSEVTAHGQQGLVGGGTPQRENGHRSNGKCQIEALKGYT